MGKRKFRSLLVFFVLFFLSNAVYSQNSTYTGSVPEKITIPTKTQFGNYPLDLVIGVLGRGSAPEDAYLKTRTFLNDIISNNELKDSKLDSNVVKEINKLIEDVKPTKVRIGGGRVELDGSVSFIFRFIQGRNDFCGEVYLKDSLEIKKPISVIQGNISELVLNELNALPDDNDLTTEEANIDKDNLEVDTAKVNAQPPLDIPSDKQITSDDTASTPDKNIAAATDRWIIDEILIVDKNILLGMKSVNDDAQVPYERFY